MEFVINDDTDGDVEEEEELTDRDVDTAGNSTAESANDELTAEDENKQRERELTDKYLQGSLSFKDFLKEINNEEKEEEEEESDDDEEWTPPGKKSKSAKKSRPTSPEHGKVKSNRQSFEEELENSQKAQLKRKKKVVGSRSRSRSR